MHRIRSPTLTTQSDALDLAAQAAIAIRQFNHATRPGTRHGLTYPGDAYTAVADLKTLAGHLPQALDQLAGFLADLHTAGHLRLDDGTDPAPAIGQADEALQQAAAAAVRLREALNTAHSVLGPVSYQDRAAAARQRTTSHLERGGRGATTSPAATTTALPWAPDAGPRRH